MLKKSSATLTVLCVLALSPADPLLAAAPYLVKDINPGGAGSNSSPTSFMDLGNGIALFAAFQGSTGTEFWRTDGTTAGTYLVTDLVPGAGSSSPLAGPVVSGVAYSRLTTSAAGTELFRSDGTAAGTSLVSDINPGAASSFANYTVALGNLLLFNATNGSSGFELWRSDGTAAGTALVKDINPGAGHSSPFNLRSLGGLVYFRASDGSNGDELWRSDGTSAGTYLVKDINPGVGSSNPSNFAELDGLVYFVANNGSNGRELWVTDGTSAGTTMVLDIRPGSASAFDSEDNYRFAVVGDRLFLVADDGVHGVEPWISDGTAAGTLLVGDLVVGSGSSYPDSFRDLAGIAVFAASPSASGRELWRSDGTAAGTTLVKDVGPGAASGLVYGPYVFAGRVFFGGNDGSTNEELWASDGTTAGTTRIADINPGAGRGLAGWSLAQAGHHLYFNADSGSTGWELWALNLDEVAPSAPTSFTSNPATGIWTSTTALEVSWSGAADELSGLAGYSFLFDTSPATEPDTTVDLAQTADPHAANGAATSDGDWYFHVRACDRAGNCGPTAHHGPLRIDVTDPAAPTDLASLSHTLGEPNDDATIDVSWTAGADATSGTVGHAWSFSGSSDWTCDEAMDGAGGSTTSDPLASGSWWFHVCSVDAAGNWGPVASIGPFLLDLEGAQVTSFGSVADTEDGVVSPNEQFVSGPTQLLTRFDEPMALASVESTANYLLVEAGPDRAVETLSCAGGPLDDDQAKSLGWSIYDASPPIAAIGLSARIPAPQGTYRLFACSALEDVAGNPLNGDGLPGDGEDRAVDFYVQATNLLTNPNFDGDLGSWATGATAGALFAYSTDDADGAASSGAIRLDATPSGADTAHFEQCFALPVPTRLRVAGHLAVGGGEPETSPALDFAVEGFDQPGCAGSSLGSTTVPLRIGPTPGEGWEPFQRSLIPPGGTQSARLRVRATAGSSTPFAVRFDSLAIDDGALFTDDFETGDGARWSVRFPPF